MSSFKQFIIKEVYHITRDFRTLLVLFGMPVAQLLIFGFAIRTEINDADIAIIDHSKDNITQEITNKLLSSGYFRLKGYYPSERSVLKAFESGEVKEIIIFGQNFAHRLEREGSADIQLILDASNPNYANLLSSYTTSIIRDYQQSLVTSGESAKAMILPEIKMMYNPEMKSVYMFVPGLVAFILMLVSALMTSIAITREKEMGTMEVLLVSPLKPGLIIIGKVIPYILLSFINAITILLVALSIFEIPFRGSVLLFAFETVLFVLTALSLGIFISTIAKTQQVAMMISLAGLLMPTTLLSGFIFPVENMPVILQAISSVIPATWFLVILKGIMLKGVGIEVLWKETAVLAGMTLIFIILSIKKFKVRLE